MSRAVAEVPLTLVSEPYRFVRHGRNLRAAVTLASLWLGLLILYVGFEAHPLIVAGLALTTAPAIRDLVTNRQAGMSVDDEALTWFSGAHETRVRLDQIAAIRLDTRLDFTTRLTCLTHQAERLRAPIEATPPRAALETALKARNIPVTSHHFSLSG